LNFIGITGCIFYEIMKQVKNVLLKV